MYFLSSSIHPRLYSNHSKGLRIFNFIHLAHILTLITLFEFLCALRAHFLKFYFPQVMLMNFTYLISNYEFPKLKLHFIY